jgi:hypothetical protein
MARRLSVFADLQRFAVPDTPRWRTHWETSSMRMGSTTR